MKKLALMSLVAGLFLAGCGEDYLVTNKDLPDDFLKSPKLEECRTMFKEDILDANEQFKRYKSEKLSPEELSELEIEFKNFKNPSVEDKIQRWKSCLNLSKDVDSLSIMKRALSGER